MDPSSWCLYFMYINIMSSNDFRGYRSFVIGFAVFLVLFAYVDLRKTLDSVEVHLDSARLHFSHPFIEYYSIDRSWQFSLDPGSSRLMEHTHGPVVFFEGVPNDLENTPDSYYCLDCLPLNMRHTSETGIDHDQLISSSQHTLDTNIDHDPPSPPKPELRSMFEGRGEDAVSFSKPQVLVSSSDTDFDHDQSRPSSQHTLDTDTDHDPPSPPKPELRSMFEGRGEDAVSFSEPQVLVSSSDTDLDHDQSRPSSQHTLDTDNDHDPLSPSAPELQSMLDGRGEDAGSFSEPQVLVSSSDTDILIDQSSSNPVVESEPSPITHSSTVSDSSYLIDHNLIASSSLSTPDHSSSQSSFRRHSIGVVIAFSSMCSVAILSSIWLYNMSMWIASQHRIRGVPHDPLPAQMI